MQTRASRLGQVVRFCFAGTAGVIAYYAALYGLTEYLDVWYVASAVIGFVLNTGLNFALQKFWTFRDKETRVVGRQLALYTAMTVLLFLGNTVFLYLAVECLHMWYIGAQVILTGVISALSFIFSKRIFRPSSPEVYERPAK